MKTCLYYALIIPIATNTCEPWIILKENERLSEFGIKGLRSKLSINLCDHNQNECIKQLLNVENIIRDIICKKSSGLVISIIYPTPAIHTTQIIVIPSFSSNYIQKNFVGKRPKGRPLNRWCNKLKANTDLPLQRLCQNRDKWKKVDIRNVEKLSGVCK